MFDFGWPELFVIIVIGVLVIGPDEIPAMMYGLGRIVRRLQHLRYAFTSQFDDFLSQTDMEKLQREAYMRKTGSTESEQQADEALKDSENTAPADKSEDEGAS